MIHIRNVAIILVAVAGCATHPGPEAEPDTVRTRYDAAVRALTEGRDATDDLAWVAARCDGTLLGSDAAILLAATYLDPRRPDRPLEDAAAVAGHLLRRDLPGDRRPVATTLYLLALELGAGYVPATEAGPAARDTGLRPDWTTIVPAAGCGRQLPLRDDTAGATLPDPGRDPVPARLRALRLDRGRIAAVADSLRRELEAANATLAQKQEELERLRRLLKP